MAWRVAIVGLTGVGKSTIGKALAEELGAVFRDLDKEIEKVTGCEIRSIFEQYGEDRFRELEKKTLLDLAETIPQQMVLSTGGGAVISPENRNNLREKYTTIWLVASPEVIATRLGHSGVQDRPLLQEGSLVPRLAQLEAERRSYYQEVADLIINVENKDVATITAEIMTVGGWQKCSE